MEKLTREANRPRVKLSRARRPSRALENAYQAVMSAADPTPAQRQRASANRERDRLERLGVQHARTLAVKGQETVPDEEDPDKKPEEEQEDQPEEDPENKPEDTPEDKPEESGKDEIPPAKDLDAPPVDEEEDRKTLLDTEFQGDANYSAQHARQLAATNKGTNQTRGVL